MLCVHTCTKYINAYPRAISHAVVGIQMFKAALNLYLWQFEQQLNAGTVLENILFLLVTKYLIIIGYVNIK